MKKVIGIFSLILLLSAAVFFLPSKQKDLTIIGFVNQKDGIGKQSTDLMDAFEGELKMNLIHTRGKTTKKKPEFGKVILFEEMLWWPKQEKYKKILSSNRDTSIRIAYSVWESTQIPQEWVMILNEHFDAVCVPSKFLVTAYQNSGVKIPIFELPLGLNLSKFLKEPLKSQKNTPFVFGNLSACSERKNQVQLIKAFAKAFGNNPNVQLRINCRYGEREVSNAITREIVAQNLNNVIFTQFALSEKEYIDLFKTLDCYVSPSKGEGFSIQPREAMALGIPVIATNNTGQEPICASGLIKSIKTPLKEIAIFPWGDSYGHNFNCEVDELANALIEVYENYDVHLAQSNQAREWASSYQYENLKSQYKTLIRPKKVHLGKEDALIGEELVTTSKDLYEKYQKVFNFQQ